MKTATRWTWTAPNDFPIINWVVKDLGIAPGAIMIWSAFVNEGKTMIAADMAVCIANGLPVFNRFPVQRSGKILHIDFEAGEEMSHIYYQRLLNGRGLTSYNNIDFLRPDWKLDELDDCKLDLEERLKGYTFCIVDCYSAGAPNTDQNSESARAPIDNLNAISEKTGCAILLLCHDPKAATGKGLMRAVKGSGSIIAAAGCSYHIKKDENNGSTGTLTRVKNRLGNSVKVVAYEYVRVGDYNINLNDKIGCKFSINEINQEREDAHLNGNLVDVILELINMSPGINTRAIIHQVKGDDHSIINSIKYLIDSNKVRLDVKGKAHQHYITPDGEAYLVNGK